MQAVEEMELATFSLLLQQLHLYKSWQKSRSYKNYTLLWHREVTEYPKHWFSFRHQCVGFPSYYPFWETFKSFQVFFLTVICFSSVIDSKYKVSIALIFHFLFFVNSTGSSLPIITVLLLPRGDLCSPWFTRPSPENATS